MKLEKFTGTAPSRWASYFINGDLSGMDDPEIAQADRFAEWLGGNIVDREDAGFMVHHDARQFGVLASDCQTYTALVQLTPVMFRMGKRRGESEVTAVFPTLPGDTRGLMMVCYAHVGQHSACSTEWLATTRQATVAEYADLKRELESAPYHYHFKVYARMQRAFDDARRASVRRLEGRVSS